MDWRISVHPIVCIDDKNGMLFHHRRLSRDRLLVADVQHLCSGRRLWMNAYSATLFADGPAHFMVAEDYLYQALPGDFCFVEDALLLPVIERIETLYLYKWKRVYPADLFLDLLPEQYSWICAERKDFTGFSHLKITREHYVRRRENGQT